MTVELSSTVSVFDEPLNVIVPSFPSPIVKDSFNVIVLPAETAFSVILLFCVVKLPPKFNSFPSIAITPAETLVIVVSEFKSS